MHHEFQDKSIIESFDFCIVLWLYGPFGMIWTYTFELLWDRLIHKSVLAAGAALQAQHGQCHSTRFGCWLNPWKFQRAFSWSKILGRDKVFEFWILNDNRKGPPLPWDLKTLHLNEEEDCKPRRDFWTEFRSSSLSFVQFRIPSTTEYVRDRRASGKPFASHATWYEAGIE